METYLREVDPIGRGPREEPVDAGIKKVVAGLWANGLPTIMSCAGHSPKRAPWVIVSPDPGSGSEDDARRADHEWNRRLRPRLSRLLLEFYIRAVPISSMEEESEYSFWHVLVRDVAYAQIPRAERAERHRRAAAWIERVGGERVEDLAEILAHHYTQALELATAAGRKEEATALEAPALRFLLLAGERALGLDTGKALATLARAWSSRPRGTRSGPRS